MIYMVECDFSDPSKETSWNAYYSGQKLDEVLAVPGFRSSQRFRLLSRSKAPAYLAIHTVDAGVLEGTAYRRNGGGSFHHWQPFIANWRRHLFGGMNFAPAIPLDHYLAVIDADPVQARDSGSIASGITLWHLQQTGLDGGVPHRAIGDITATDARRIMAERASVHIYAPMMTQRLEASDKRI